MTDQDALRLFIDDHLAEGVVPTRNFDEEFYCSYYADVGHAKDSGDIPSGYVHFVVAGRTEGRLPMHNVDALLRRKMGDLAYPVGIERTSALEAKLGPLVVRVSGVRAPTVNVFVSSLDPDLFFGGYIAFLHFLARGAERGWRLRFVVTEDAQANHAWFLRGIRGVPRWHSAFQGHEFVNLAGVERRLDVSPLDRCIAYSVWDAILAQEVVNSTVVKKFCFFIQEDERVFHSSGSIQFIVNDAYKTKYYPIVNSSMLYRYFMEKNPEQFGSIPIS